MLTAEAPGASACPYNFQKPACHDAEPQAPRDLSTGAMGYKTPKAATLNDAQAMYLPLANTHFHYGAEHKSDSYSDSSDADAYDNAPRRLADNRRLASNVRPGFMCPTTDLTTTQLAPYTFQYCKGQVEVGKSYEVHYVHSSAGYTPADLASDTNLDLMSDGLGGAANGRGQLNPMIVVQAQVYQLVQEAQNVTDMLHGWTVVGHANSVMYSGSTTGPSHDNMVCSPYVITWHVDKECHRITPQSFDNLCQQMQAEYGLENDLYPHGSRILVAPQFVVNETYVTPLA